jgi:addiction module HigA family antidote
MSPEKRVATHPGVALFYDFLRPRSVSMTELAEEIEAPRIEIARLVMCEREIDDALAEKLGKYFGNSKEFWMNLQAAYNASRQK